jgi:hypothetical protein
MIVTQSKLVKVGITEESGTEELHLVANVRPIRAGDGRDATTRRRRGLLADKEIEETI